jgi:hypothetical protein
MTYLELGTRIDKGHGEPITVTGPYGIPITARDLPSGNMRWHPKTKAIVLAAVLGGILSKEDVEKRYSLSSLEIDRWQKLYEAYGIHSLRSSQEMSIPLEKTEISGIVIAEEMFQIGDVTVSPAISMISGNGNQVELIEPQLKLLTLFYARRGTVVTWSMVCEWMWGQPRSHQSYKVYISKVNKPLSAVSTSVRIKSIMHRGYYLDL